MNSARCDPCEFLMHHMSCVSLSKKKGEIKEESIHDEGFSYMCRSLNKHQNKFYD